MEKTGEDGVIVGMEEETIKFLEMLYKFFNSLTNR